MVVNRQLSPLIKILVVDDLRVVREKLKSVLKLYSDFQVIGTAIDGNNAIEQLEYLDPDIILLDLDMPNLDGMETARIIDRKYPHIQVIILSSYDDLGGIDNLQPSCVKEYIVKDIIDLKIADRIRSVYHARNSKSRPVTDNLATELISPHDNIVEFNRPTLAHPMSIVKHPDRDFTTNLSTQLDRKSVV